MMVPPAARADEELSAFEKRRLEGERRRELLRQAREKAERAREEAEETKVEAADAAAEEEADASQRRAEVSRKLSTSAYEEAAAKSLKAPPANPLEGNPLNFSLPPPPEKLSDIKVPDLPTELPKLPSFSFGKPAAPEEAAEEAKAGSPVEEAPPVKVKSFFSRPAPEPAAPAPVVEAPAPPPVRAPPPPPPPAPVRKPVVVEAPVAVRKAEAPEVKPGKRTGPLPGWLAQLIVLGLLGGVIAAATKYYDTSEKVVLATGAFIKSAYQKAEAALAKKQ